MTAEGVSRVLLLVAQRGSEGVYAGAVRCIRRCKVPERALQTRLLFSRLFATDARAAASSPAPETDAQIRPLAVAQAC